jgi:hypothetical protein
VVQVFGLLRDTVLKFFHFTYVLDRDGNIVDLEVGGGCEELEGFVDVAEQVRLVVEPSAGNFDPLVLLECVVTIALHGNNTGTDICDLENNVAEVKALANLHISAYMLPERHKVYIVRIHLAFVADLESLTGLNGE